MRTSIQKRRIKERDRLRAKRADPQYLAAQRANRAKQMRETRRARRRAGQCRECDEPKLPGRCYCAAHLEYARARSVIWRARRRQRRKPVKAPATHPHAPHNP